MAYMNQEKKATIKSALQKVMPKDWKWSLSVDNHSTIVITIKSAPVDLIDEVLYVSKSNQTEKPVSHDVNIYWLDEQFDFHLELFKNILCAAKSAEWFDESDVQSDYFHTAYYIDIRIGRWNKPFIVTGEDQ